MSKYGIEKVDGDFLESLDALQGRAGSKYVRLGYSNSKPLLHFKRDGKTWSGFRCKCSQYFIMPNQKLAYLKGHNATELFNLNCGCILEENRRVRLEEGLKEFNTKLPKSEENPHFCNYCESYRRSTTKESKNTYYCENCKYLQANKIKLGKSFDQIMEDWDSSTHNGKFKRLPFLKGNCNKGYEVKGFAYVDSSLYESLSKVLWIKSKTYVLMNLSKDNISRLGSCEHNLNIEEGRTNFLHRVVFYNGTAETVDHANGKTLDNRSSNLRAASFESNNHNSRTSKNKDVKFKGVFRRNTKKKGYTYRVHIDRNDFRYYQGGFKCEEEAALHYDQVLRENCPSDFNAYNFPLEGEQGCIR
ncbi:hypothetical protein [Vibrio phage S4-7]|nr:hypothetical protein [Vibrio phage S4-7]